MIYLPNWSDTIQKKRRKNNNNNNNNKFVWYVVCVCVLWCDPVLFPTGKSHNINNKVDIIRVNVSRFTI